MLFSEHGKWRALSKKAKRLGGNPGKLSLFHDVTAQYYRRAEDDLALITQVQLNGALPRLSLPEIYPYAHVLAELVDKLSVDVHVGEHMHSYLASGLRGLSEHDSPETVAILYSWKLMQQAGLAPRVLRCVTCGNKANVTHFDVANGGLSCESCQTGFRISAEVASDLQRIFTQTLKEVLEQPLSELSFHWTLISRYTAYHVADLKSLRGIAALSYA